jgi:hypothetical protein
VAEIKIERGRRGGILPWILALALLVLVIWGVGRAMERRPAPAVHSGAAAADSLQDDTPPRLRQYAALGPGLRAAA